MRGVKVRSGPSSKERATCRLRDGPFRIKMLGYLWRKSASVMGAGDRTARSGPPARRSVKGSLPRFAAFSPSTDRSIRWSEAWGCVSSRDGTGAHAERATKRTRTLDSARRPIRLRPFTFIPSHFVGCLPSSCFPAAESMHDTYGKPLPDRHRERHRTNV